jgi:hypothetical protein
MDIPNSGALCYFPQGVSVDGAGTVYLADPIKNAIREAMRVGSEVDHLDLFQSAAGRCPTVSINKTHSDPSAQPTCPHLKSQVTLRRWRPGIGRGLDPKTESNLLFRWSHVLGAARVKVRFGRLKLAT